MGSRTFVALRAVVDLGLVVARHAILAAPPGLRDAEGAGADLEVEALAAEERPAAAVLLLAGRPADEGRLGRAWEEGEGERRERREGDGELHPWKKTRRGRKKEEEGRRGGKQAGGKTRKREASPLALVPFQALWSSSPDDRRRGGRKGGQREAVARHRSWLARSFAWAACSRGGGLKTGVKARRRGWGRPRGKRGCWMRSA